ncbi:MBL fold metallo-hydrolase [Metapseudomonas lalkuanensis]|uniref:MBL fold metallo-hydrolase n=1 Tax=Pseudomonadaceae TaxID=135621 RepID=UPI001CF23805|nr:MBL fold metallo-hydrolase [Pseudomonas lalkuanensis]UCP00827.1 MBL fold metallo-hydrolase [Pseudomonas lalkuanensis]
MNRSISMLAGRSRKLDGGALFGATPRRMWVEWMSPNHDNQVEVATRALLVQQGGLNILVMAGTDALLAPPPRTCRCQRPAVGLLDSLAELGLGEGQIHAVVLPHLHAVLPPDVQDAIQDGNAPRLLFPTARYLTGRRHWLRAQHPHPRDRGLFVPQIIRQLESSGRLKLLDEKGCDLLGAGWRFHLSDGYTPGQLLPEIDMPGGPVVFAGDLVPAVHWLRLDLTTALDRNPECLIDEKERLLDHLVANGGRLFLPRDPDFAMIKVLRDRQSRYQAFDQHTELHRLDS